MDLSGKSKIVLTGGVALNCKMIHNLSKQDFFEKDLPGFLWNSK